MDGQRQTGPVARFAWEVAGGVALYLALFVIGPQLADSTSELRLKLAEAHDRLAELRNELRVERFRREINELERMVTQDAEA